MFAAEDHARTGEPGHQAALFVGDVAFVQHNRAAAADYAARGDQLTVPNRLQEVDLKLQRGEAFAFLERGGGGCAHGGVAQVAKDASVKGAHGISMFWPRVHFEGNRALGVGDQAKADQLSNGRFHAVVPALKDIPGVHRTTGGSGLSSELRPGSRSSVSRAPVPVQPGSPAHPDRG